MTDTFRALVIDPDFSALSRAAGLLDHGFRIVARKSPVDAREYIGRTRPDVVLLAPSFWLEGWGAEILSASPETVVLPSRDLPLPAEQEHAA